jgi:HK97 family phage major capsid protein
MPKSNPNSVILDIRTMTSGTAGANTIQTTVQSNIHDFMQQKSIMANLGATTFGNNVGDLDIPLGTSASGATVIATDGTTQSAETTPTLSKLTLSPTRIADVVPLSYGFLQQSTPDVEAYVRRLIAQTFAKTMDEQIIAGSGSGGNVQGILGTSGINTVSNGGTEVDFDNFVSAISELGTDAVDLSNLKLIINPANIDNLVTAVKYASTDSPILDMKAEQDGRIGTFNGYPVYATSACTADNYIMGDFRELAIATWGGIEISKNDFYDDRRFISSLNAIMSFDAGLLEPKAMCKITKA